MERKLKLAAALLLILFMSSGIVLWGLPSGQLFVDPVRFCEIIAEISEDGSYVVASGVGHNLALFSKHTATPIWVAERADYATVSPRGEYIIHDTGYDHSIQLITKDRRLLWTYHFPRGFMKTATFSSDGDWVVVDAYEGVYLFGREDNVPEWTFAVDEVFSVAISENGDYIAAGTSEGVYLFGREDNVPEWTYLKSNPLFVVISSDGEFIAAAFDDFYVFPQWVDYPPDINVVRLFSRYDNVPIWIHEFGGGSLDISSDGRYLAFVKGRERLRVFDRVENLLIVDLPTPFRAFKGRGHINWISMSADGKYIALGVEDTTRGFFQRKSDFVALFSVPENRVLWVY